MRRLRELRPALFEWDPIGFAKDLPDDEYDCIFSPLLSRLRDAPTESELAAWLGRYGEDHFGVSARPESDHAAARAVLAWWRSAAGDLPANSRALEDGS